MEGLRPDSRCGAMNAKEFDEMYLEAQAEWDDLSKSSQRNSGMID